MYAMVSYINFCLKLSTQEINYLISGLSVHLNRLILVDTVRVYVLFTYLYRQMLIFLLFPVSGIYVPTN